MSIPSAGYRARFENALAELINAIESHELFAQPRPHRVLYYMWDFAQRSKYMLSEIDNIRDGKAVKHPDQLASALSSPPGQAPRTGPAAAASVYKDVHGRCLMSELLMGNMSKTARQSGPSDAAVDFGPLVAEKAKALTVLLMSPEGQRP